MQALRRRVQEASEVRLVAGGGRQVVILRGPRSGRAEGDLGHRRQVGGEQRPVGAAVAPDPQRAGGRAHGKALAGGIDVEGMAVNEIIRSEEPTSELQSLMRISYAVF